MMLIGLKPCFPYFSGLRFFKRISKFAPFPLPYHKTLDYGGLQLGFLGKKLNCIFPLVNSYACVAYVEDKQLQVAKLDVAMGLGKQFGKLSLMVHFLNLVSMAHQDGYHLGLFCFSYAILQLRPLKIHHKIIYATKSSKIFEKDWHHYFVLFYSCL